MNRYERCKVVRNCTIRYQKVQNVRKGLCDVVRIVRKFTKCYENVQNDKSGAILSTKMYEIVRMVQGCVNGSKIFEIVRMLRNGSNGTKC